MIWEGLCALPFVLETEVIILEHETEGTSERALSLFAAKAQRAVGLRGEVNIRIASSRELQELNRRFRRQNRPTDVLSFPSDTPRLAGDIAISGEIAAANAAAMGHSPQTELKVLILHGILHLAGFDHETDDGEMRARETILRRKLGLPVGLIERAHAGIPERTASRKSSARSAGSRSRRSVRR
jgi:probable rRNA maturation factor